jgi:hypothetical protein
MTNETEAKSLGMVVGDSFSYHHPSLNYLGRWPRIRTQFQLLTGAAPVIAHDCDDWDDQCDVCSLFMTILAPAVLPTDHRAGTCICIERLFPAAPLERASGPLHAAATTVQNHYHHPSTVHPPLSTVQILPTVATLTDHPGRKNNLVGQLLSW